MSKQRFMLQESRPYFSPPSSGPATSVAAAEAIKPKAGTLRRMVFDFISARGPHGATREEIELALQLSGNTLRPRVKELEEQNLITVLEDRTRPTTSGRQANVIVAVR